VSLQTDLSLSPGAVKLLRIRQGSVALGFEPTIIPIVDAGPFLARPFRPDATTSFFSGSLTPGGGTGWSTTVRHTGPGAQVELKCLNVNWSRSNAPTTFGRWQIILAIRWSGVGWQQIFSSTFMSPDMSTAWSMNHVFPPGIFLGLPTIPSGVEFQISCIDVSAGGFGMVDWNLWGNIQTSTEPLA